MMELIFATIVVFALGSVVGLFAAGKGLEEMKHYMEGVNEHGNSNTGEELHQSDCAIDPKVRKGK